MSFAYKIVLLAIACSLGACSIHPVPQDVTGVKTATIVHQNRCEARNAVIDGQIRYLQHLGYPVDDLPSLRAVKGSKTFNPVVKQNLAYFESTGIVYSYSLNGTETNGLTLSADVIEPLTYPGTAELSPSVANSLSRGNIRTFTISDSFGALIAPAMDDYCKISLPGPDIEYPIVGEIGIGEMVRTFIELVTKDDLGVQQDPSKGLKLSYAPSSSAPIAMVDTISFTTTISAGITPKISFSPVGHTWQLMDAMLTSTNMRVDTHEVIIGLGLASVPPPGIPAAHYFGGNVVGFGPNVAGFSAPALITAVAPSSTSGETTALTAVNQQILRFEVPKSLIVAP